MNGIFSDVANLSEVASVDWVFRLWIWPYTLVCPPLGWWFNY